MDKRMTGDDGSKYKSSSTKPAQTLIQTRERKHQRRDSEPPTKDHISRTTVVVLKSKRAARATRLMQSNRNNTRQTEAVGSSNETSGTAQQLENLCRYFLACLNSRQFDESLALYFSSDFVGLNQNAATSSSFAESILNCRSIIRRYPQFIARPITITANVDEAGEQAAVFLSAETFGYPDAFRRETTSVFKWRKQAGRWMCYHHEWISGMSWPYNGR